MLVVCWLHSHLILLVYACNCYALQNLPIQHQYLKGARHTLLTPSRVKRLQTARECRRPSAQNRAKQKALLKTVRLVQPSLHRIPYTILQLSYRATIGVKGVYVPKRYHIVAKYWRIPCNRRSQSGLRNPNYAYDIIQACRSSVLHNTPAHEVPTSITTSTRASQSSTSGFR